jgi:hypothetical protein
MIYKTEDKTNERLDRQLMSQFRRFLIDACLKEIHLNGHLFTWINERSHPIIIDVCLKEIHLNDHLFTWINKRSHPTLERMDQAFISRE